MPKAYEQLKKEQDELDAEIMSPCPDCGSPRTWGEIRKVGCLECYYQDYLQKTGQQLTK